MSKKEQTKKVLGVAVLTVSDTRRGAEDTSGNYLVRAVNEAGHRMHAHAAVPDDIYQIRARVSEWIANSAVQAVLCTGGTGFGPRDCTPEALLPLLDVRVDGFGELFRTLSYDEIGNSTMLSRALAGVAGGTLIACMPGSTSACVLAWERILLDQLNSTHAPCNFAEVLDWGGPP
jgi:molybdenum cofactor biosynthesis protein B